MEQLPEEAHDPYIDVTPSYKDVTGGWMVKFFRSLRVWLATICVCCIGLTVGLFVADLSNPPVPQYDVPVLNAATTLEIPSYRSTAIVPVPLQETNKERIAYYTEALALRSAMTWDAYAKSMRLRTYEHGVYALPPEWVYDVDCNAKKLTVKSTDKRVLDCAQNLFFPADALEIMWRPQKLVVPQNYRPEVVANGVTAYTTAQVLYRRMQYELRWPALKPPQQRDFTACMAGLYVRQVVPDANQLDILATKSALALMGPHGGMTPDYKALESGLTMTLPSQCIAAFWPGPKVS